MTIFLLQPIFGRKKTISWELIFSRVLTLRYGNSVSNYLNTKYQAISVGRVMTCVLGMVVRREREIRAFVKTPFYRVLSSIALEGENFEERVESCGKAADISRLLICIKRTDLKRKPMLKKLIQELLVSQPLAMSSRKSSGKREQESAAFI